MDDAIKIKICENLENNFGIILLTQGRGEKIYNMLNAIKEDLIGI